MISPSISAAVAEAHLNDLLADADTARQARLARLANAAGRNNRRRWRPRFQKKRILLPGQVAPAAVRSLTGTGRISRTAIVCAPGEGDAR